MRFSHLCLNYLVCLSVIFIFISFVRSYDLQSNEVESNSFDELESNQDLQESSNSRDTRSHRHHHHRHKNHRRRNHQKQHKIWAPWTYASPAGRPGRIG